MYEYGDKSLIEWTSDFAHTVAELAGLPFKPAVASQRDEPGVTRAAIPLLTSRGVTGLTMGVDWASPVAKVPRAFVWKDTPSNTELLVAWHNYGYGGGHSGRDGTWNNSGGPQWCQSAPPPGEMCNSTLSVPGLDHALAYFIQDDNFGPPKLGQLQYYLKIVKQMFPNATSIIPSTYDAFFAELQKVKHTLPVSESYPALICTFHFAY